MRLLLVLALPLALAACNKGDSSQNRAEAERNVTTEVASTNDTTAIDAATGEAANMAADVNFLPEELDALDNEAAPAVTTPRPAPSRSAATEPEPADPDADTGE